MRIKHEAPGSARYLAIVAASGAVPAALITLAYSTVPRIALALLAGLAAGTALGGGLGVAVRSYAAAESGWPSADRARLDELEPLRAVRDDNGERG